MLGFLPGANHLLQKTFALVQGLKPHPQELELQQVHHEPEPGENYYKQGECYPYLDEDQA